MAKRIWTDRIKFKDGLYEWSLLQGNVEKKSGIAFTIDEANDELLRARDGFNK